MNSSLPVLSVNLLPPEKLYCNFSYWSSLFSQDMQILWDRAHGVPLEKLPKGVSDMIFPYLLLALSDYKTSQINKMNGIGCLLYTSPSPRDRTRSRMPSSA